MFIIDKAKAFVAHVIGHKVYHVCHDWTAIACIVVTFEELHGVGQIVFGVALAWAIIDWLLGDHIDFGG